MNEAVVVTGVYLLFQEQQLIYVGRSSNVYNRIAQHRQNGRPFDYAAVVNLPAADAAWVERSLIDALTQPKQRETKAVPPAPLVVVKQPDIRERQLPDVMTSASAFRLLVQARGFPLKYARFQAAIADGVIPAVEGRPSGRNHHCWRHVLRADVEVWIKAELQRLGYPVERMEL